MQQQIAVVMGGFGTDGEVARRAGEGVALALEQRGHDVLRVQVGPTLEVTLREAGVDVAFLVLEGALAQDGSVQARLELLGIPYTGAGANAVGLVGNHRRARERLQLHNLPLAIGYSLRADPSQDALGVHGDLGFPCRVRPVCTVSGVDAMQVAAAESLSAAVAWAQQFSDEVQVERVVPGLRVTVALLEGEVLGLQVAAADAAALRKSRSASLSPTRRANLEALARGASRALGCRGPLLVEFAVPAEDNEVIAAIDAAPRLAPRGTFATVAGQSVSSYAQLIERVAGAAQLETSRLLATRAVVRESFEFALAS